MRQGMRLHWPYTVKYPQTNSETASGVEQEAWYPPYLPTATRGDKPVAMVMVHIQHISSKSAVNLSAFSRLSPLSSVSVCQKGDWLYSELLNKRSLELKFLYIIVLCKPSDNYTEIMS